MTRRSALLNVMIAAVQKAGRGLVRDFGEVEQLQVSRKGPADFVSVADTRAERVLRQELQKARPGFALLMEEAGAIAGTDQQHCWIVDPLDGTLNFLHGIPQFAISVALRYRNDIIAGVVFNPVTDELYWAERGNGAWLHDRRLRVSARRELADSVVGTGIPSPAKQGHPAYLAQLREVMASTAGVRRMGAAALDLAWVASGRYDAFWESHLSPWDVAAGALLVREAGGFVTDLEGRSEILDAVTIVAANDPLHRPFRELVRQAGRDAAAAPPAPAPA